MTTSTIEALMAQMGGGAAAAAGIGSSSGRGDKVTVVGSGALAIATLFALIAQRVSKEIVVIDTDVSKIQKEILDIEDAALYMGSPNITVTTNWERCRDSRVVIISLGDEQVMELERSTRLVRAAILPMEQACPGAVVLIATRPTDVLAWCAWCTSNIAPHQVLGVGCTLETARLRRAVARKLRISTNAVQATVLGRATPAWTSIAACGVRLREVNPKLGAPDDPENWPGTLNGVINIPGMKAMAAAAAHITEAIIRDTRECMPVATHISGSKGQEDPYRDVFMSLPCVISQAGVAYIVRQALSQEEKKELQVTADTLCDIQSKLDIT